MVKEELGELSSSRTDAGFIPGASWISINLHLHLGNCTRKDVESVCISFFCLEGLTCIFLKLIFKCRSSSEIL